MPAISYKEYGGGLDRRLAIGVQDANKLWTLKNAYITSGKKIKKRPALLSIGAGAFNQVVDLAAVDGRLKVFAETGSGVTFPALSDLLDVVELDPYPTGSYALIGIVYAQLFQGFLYVIGKYRNNAAPREIQYRHHYINGGGTLITDVNCPHGASATKAASRIYATAGDVVRYCAAGDATDWTTASDAGFLAVGLQQDSKSDCTAVGTFESSLVVFFPEGTQTWAVAFDPSASQLTGVRSGVGTIHPNSLASFYRDLVFASPFGVRSITVQENVERLDETDVGVPVDDLVQVVQAAHEADSDQNVRGVWVQQFGQYWLLFEQDGYTRAFVYSYSRSSKLACWSDYEFPNFLILGMATIAGKVYARTSSSLYELSATTYVDDTVLIDVDVQMAFQDAKLPGVEKMFYGADFVFSGTAEVSYLYDPSDPDKETTPYTVTGDTRSGTVIPVEVSAAAIAPRFQHSADEAFGLDMATLYFHQLSASV